MVNAHAQARRTYAATAQAVKTPRNIEFAVLARVTKNLQNGAKNRAKDFPGFVKALDQNRQMWDIFAQDLLDPENKLPDPLKVQILGLAEFTRKQTQQVLTQKAAVKPLLEINAALLRGLKDG